MLYKEDGAFLEWIAQRMIHKFGDSPEHWHVRYLKDIGQRIYSQTVEISNSDLDKIIATYYVDFFLDKTDTYGFSESDRISMRDTIKNICTDIMNKTISNPLIGP